MRRTDFSPARQHFLDVCRDLGFGFIRNLRVDAHEPVLPPPSDIVRDIVFGKRNGPHKVEASADYVLRAEVIEFFSYLDLLGDCVIEMLIVKHGLPFQMQVPKAA
jgi:hypothetical protein